MSSHEGIFLLKSGLSIPKLLYLMHLSSKASPSFGTQGDFRFDEASRSALGLVKNCYLTDEALFQAALPVRWGVLGVRGISTLASSALLASVASVQVWATSLLPPHGAVPLAGMVRWAEAD